MEYVSKNKGLLSVDQVKTGDKLVILEVSTYFNEKSQEDKWNVKVELPNKLHKMSSPMDTTMDAMADKWGKMTEDWVGHTLLVEVRHSEKKNVDYIWLTPTDDPKVEIPKVDLKAAAEVSRQSGGSSGIEYPTEEINPDDIPF